MSRLNTTFWPKVDEMGVGVLMDANSKHRIVSVSSKTSTDKAFI